MKAKILPFPGCEVPDQVASQQPQKEVIKLLEQLLEMAKTGELQAVAYAGVLENTQTINDYKFGSGSACYSLNSAALYLLCRITAELMGDDDEDPDGGSPISAAVAA
jgi:hypothetical protein